MLVSSNFDFCLDILELVKKIHLGKENLQLMQLPWEAKRTAAEETVADPCKK